MKFQQLDRDACERLLPGLADRLAAVPFDRLESPRSPAIALFRDHGGTNLLVPRAYGGIGASALEAVRVVRALASLAPSLAVATAMHHFSVGMLFSIGPLYAHNSTFRTAVLDVIAKNRSLIASGFAEGRSGRGILSPTAEAREAPAATSSPAPRSPAASPGRWTSSPPASPCARTAAAPRWACWSSPPTGPASPSTTSGRRSPWSPRRATRCASTACSSRRSTCCAPRRTPPRSWTNSTKPASSGSR
ncbi:acyl-CoA dehydrogenase family protein [Streptomyces stramineus]